MSRTNRTGLCCAGTVLVLALLGCDRQSASSKAIQAAASDMQRLRAEMVIGADDPALTREVYNKILSSLQPMASTGTDRENASVNLLLAQSKLGLAKDPATRAALFERRCGTLRTQIRALRAQWVRLNTAVTVDELYDPVDDLSRIREDIADRDREIAGLREKKNQLDAEITRLRELATAKLNAAGAERADVGALELEAGRRTARQAQPLVEEAYTRRRRANRLEVEGLGIGAEADVIVPQSEEMALDIGRVESQRSMLEAESRTMQARSDEGSARAAKARAAAGTVAKELRRTVTDLSDLRRGALKESYERADELYVSAASHARRAQSSYRQQASIAQGIALTLLADLHRAQAQGALHAAALVRTLAQTDPPLPDVEIYTNVSNAFEQARDAALEAAALNGEEATDALERANLIEVIRDSVQEIGRAFDQGEYGEFTEVDPWTLVDEIIVMAETMRFQGLPDLIHAEIQEAQVLVDMLRNVIAAFYRLDSAVQNAFDTDLMSHLQTMTGGRGMIGMPLGGDGLLSRDMFTVRTEGEIAYIGSTDPAGGGEEQRAGLVDGRWVFLLGDPEFSKIGLDSAMIESIRGYGVRAITAINGVTEQVIAGELNDIDAVVQAVVMVVMPIGQEAMIELGPQLNPGGP